MKDIIRNFLIKKIMIGGMSVKVGTITTVAVVTALAVGGTAVAVTNHALDAKTETAIVQEADDLTEMLPEQDNMRAQGNMETQDDTGMQDNTNSESSSSVTYEDENGNPVDISEEDIHTHTLSTQVVEEPTCQSAGSAYDFCPECGYTSDTYTLPANNNHVLGDWVVVSEATEVSDGLRTRSCAVCGKVIETEVIPIIPHNHNYVVSVMETASCENDGYNVYTCSICGSSYTETIGATGHNYEKQIVEDASCTLEGHIYQRCSTCGKTVETGTISAKGHNYGNWSIVEEANCTESGKETRKCSACGHTENRIIPTTGHTESNVVTTKEATCTEEGTYTYTCSVCDAVIENNVIAPLGHNYGEPEVVDSTCSTEGNKKYTCQREGCDYSYEEVIAKKDHTESEWIDNNLNIDKAPTCTEAGLKHTECTECHAVIKTEVIPATGHTWGEWEESTPAQCETTGEEKRTCSVCSEEETRKIDALGHSYEVIIDTPATCEQNGKKHEECSVCYDKLSEITIPATGHSFVNYEVVTPATDLAEGLERATCENGCGKTDERVIAKLPHTHNYDTEKTRVEATCTVDGYYILECRCGSTMKVDIPKTGHDYQATNHVDANCVLDGADTYTCSKCGDTYDTVIPATGHTAGNWEISKPATDLAEGQKVRKCTSCGTILDTQTISKLPHTCEYNILIESQEATCTTDGYELYECRCGLQDKVVVPKTNHVNAEWQTTKEATYTEMGLKEKICPDCHATLETQNIPVKPHEHDYEVTSSTNATCTEAGTTVKTCSICGNTTTIITPATGHTESAFYVDSEATCTATGSKHTECSVCHITLTTETIPATGHTEGEWKIDSSATCTDDGSKHTECTNCGTTIRTETIPSTGHSMGDWHETSSAGCENEGTEERNCSKCSYFESRSIPALGHDYGDWIVDEEATEEAEGSRHKECSRCDSKITEDIEKLPPHVHSYLETARTDSTCSNVGSITYTCDCGDSYSEEIAKKEHTPGEWTVKTPATEDSTGLEERTCTECGTQTDSRVIDKLPHTHSYTTESKSATCTEDGYEKQTCACGSVINTVIPATGHTYGEAVVVEPTCTKKGTSTITCKNCSHKEVTDILATGHNYVESEKTAATCEKAGSVTYECTNCGDAYSEVITKLEHEYAVTSTIEATCTEGGYTIETCKHCGDTKRTNETEATGHDDGKWTIVKEAELGVAGSKELRCTKCNTLVDTEEISMLTTDGTDSVYYFKNADGSQEMAIGHYDEEQAQEMLVLVNNYREENGLVTFTVPTTYMNSYTALRAVETSYLWDHKRPSGAGCEYAENIAMSSPDGKGNTASVQAIFDAWVASAGHKNNLDAVRTKNWTCISVFYKRCPVYNSAGEVSRYVYEAYWVETFK